VEDLSLAFMTRNRHLALSAHDAGLGMLRPLLDYKAESAGSQVATGSRKASSPKGTTCWGICAR
jgi:transposase